MQLDTALKNQFQQALNAFGHKDYVQSQKLLDSMLKQFPDFGPAWNLQGSLYFQVQNWQQAEASFKKALALGHNSASVRLNLSQALYAQTRYAEARSVLETQLAAKPDFFEGWFQLGRVLDKLDLTEAASEALKQALSLKPESVQVLELLARLQTQPEQALEYLRKGLKIKSEHVGLMLLMVQNLLLLERDQEAQEYVETILQLEPGQQESLLNLMSKAAQQRAPFRQYELHTPERLRAAQKLYEHVLEFSQAPLNAWRGLAYIYTRPDTRDLVKAEALCREAIRRFPAPEPAQDYLPDATYQHYYTLAEAQFEQIKASESGDLIDYGVFFDSESEVVSLLELTPLKWHLPLKSSAQAIVYLACDALYFRRFALPQILSMVDLRLPYRCHVHLFNPDKSCHELLQQLHSLLPLSCTFEFCDFESANAARVYYCCARFSRLWQLIQHQPDTRYISMDADCLLRRAIESYLEPDCDLALISNQQRSIYDAFSASLLVLNPTPGRDKFMGLFERFIRHNLAQRAVWMLDQFGLYCTSQTLWQQGYPLKLQKFSRDLMGSQSGYTGQELFWTAGARHKFEKNAYTLACQELLQKFGFDSVLGFD